MYPKVSKNRGISFGLGIIQSNTSFLAESDLQFQFGHPEDAMRVGTIRERLAEFKVFSR